MSIASPTALSRRAAALPMRLVDRLDAILDAGFTRVDNALDRRIVGFVDRSAKISRGLSRSTDSLDRALADRVKSFDARASSSLRKTAEAGLRTFNAAQNVLTHSEIKLDRGVDAVDQGITAGIRAAIATMNASIALTQTVDMKITSKFERIDVRSSNATNRLHRFQVKTLSTALNTTTRFDRVVETSFLRADARVNAGINHAGNVIAGSVSRAAQIAATTDTALSNAVAGIDSNISRRITQGVHAVSVAGNSVHTRTLAFERAIDLGISRIDTRVTNGVARGVATNAALVNGVRSLDLGLASALARVDSQVDSRITQTTHTFANASKLVSRRIASIDAGLEAVVTAFDSRSATGVANLATVVSGVSTVVSNQINGADNALTDLNSRVDKRAARLVELSHGRIGAIGNRQISSISWAATSLTLVLGTLGAATGSSVVNASSSPIELENSVEIEATAAKDAVAQYLSVRDSFQALQATRSRTMQTLEQEIADAQQRATQTFVDGDKIVDIASSFAGTPYVRGGTTPRGFDCSGFTSYVYAQMGMKIPRVASAQYIWSDKVNAEDRQPGDLMFWSSRGGIYHAGIYAGDGKMWDSPRPGRKVGKISIWGNPLYGRAPIEVVNASALREVESKTAELEELKANPPQLPITIDEALLAPKKISD